jgi:hypothetical protein
MFFLHPEWSLRRISIYNPVANFLTFQRKS